MNVYIDESTYQLIYNWLSALDLNPSNYIGQDDDGYYFDYIALLDAGYIKDIDGEIYLISLRPSQKGVFIGNL